MVTDVPSYYRLSRKLRDGTLTEGENLEHVEDLDETNFDEDAVGYQAELQAEVLSVVEQIEVDQWVIVLYDQQWYPGCVSEVIVFYYYSSYYSMKQKLPD